MSNKNKNAAPCAFFGTSRTGASHNILLLRIFSNGLFLQGASTVHVFRIQCNTAHSVRHRCLYRCRMSTNLRTSGIDLCRSRSSRALHCTKGNCTISNMMIITPLYKRANLFSGICPTDLVDLRSLYLAASEKSKQNYWLMRPRTWSSQATFPLLRPVE